MSRRKQSNPKPVKRMDEVEMDELAKSVNLPSSLSLQTSDVAGDNELLRVMNKSMALSLGKSFGPYSASFVSKNLESGHMLKVPGKDGYEIRLDSENGYWLKFIHLLKKKKREEANSKIIFQGKQIWCELIAEVPPDAALLAIFEGPLEQSDQTSPSLTPCVEATPSDIKMTTNGQENNELQHSAHRNVSDMSSKILSHTKSHPLIFICSECGVRFSSPSTLGAHSLYYCSKRPLLDDKPNSNASLKREIEEIRSPEKDVVDGNSAKRLKSCNDAMHKTDNDVTMANAETPVRAKTEIRHDEYGSPDSESLVGNTTDVRTHVFESKPSDTAEDGNGKKISYCNRCNIQFSSMKTYLGHKEYYCGKRQSVEVLDVVEPGTASDDEESDDISERPQVTASSSSIPVSPVPISAAVLPNLPIVHGCSPQQLILPYSIPSTLGNQQTVVFATPVVSPSGSTNITLSVPTAVLMHPILKNQHLPAHQQMIPLIRGCPSAHSEQPLDLSLKKVKTSINVKSEPETILNVDAHIDSVKSEPRSISPEIDVGTSQTSNSLIDLETNVRHPPSTDPPSCVPTSITSQLPVLVQHLTSPKLINPMPSTLLSNFNMCAECNIVFYKHDNYIIHKQYYCSGRRASKQVSHQSPNDNHLIKAASPMAECPSSKARDSSSPSFHDSSPEPGPSSPAAQQYLCTPCHIRFSSKSTLGAHQKYYCPYRSSDCNGGTNSRTSSPETAEPSGGNYRCLHCETEYPTARLLKVHLCPRTANGSGIWNLLRCPHCNFVSHKESVFNDHMKKHAGNKGFKCRICGYRGNTVRGMRMHGKMHIDKGEEFTDIDMIEIKNGGDNNERADTCHPIDSDLESEIIRIKNEPYKRRRSRYHRTIDAVAQHPDKQTPLVCRICKTGHSDYSELGIHMQTHLHEQLFKCHLCPSESLTQSAFFHHLNSKHPNSHVNLTDGQKSPDSDQASTDSNLSYRKSTEIPKSPDENVHPDFKIQIKQEPPDNEESNDRTMNIDNKILKLDDIKEELADLATDKHLSASYDAPMVKSRSPSLSPSINSSSIKTPLSAANPPPDVPPPETESSIGKYCGDCDIPFTYVSSYVAHKRYYCPGGHASKNVLNDANVTQTVCDIASK